MGLFITFFLGIFILAGALMTHLVKKHEWIEQLSIAITFGTMTALAVLDLLPEALESFKGSQKIWLPVFVVLGIIMLKILDHFIPDHDHEHGLSHDCSTENVIHIGIVSSIAVIAHNMIEGMAVYSITKESVRMGLMIALGVGLHNIPMGMIIDSTLQAEKRSHRWTLLSLVSLSTFFGGLVMLILWQVMNEFVIAVLVSLTLGMLVYIILFELLPHLMHSKHKGFSLTGAIFGILIIIISGLFG